MEFGRLPNVDRVRFDLPPEDPKSAEFLPGKPAPQGVRAYVGAPLWNCPDWVGTLYPAGTPQKDFLTAYARQFNCIELNPTFYRIPEPEQVRAWRSKVPGDFRFYPKLNQDISHLPDLPRAKALMSQFWAGISEFGENLGTCFLQLPPHFAYQQFGVLQQLIASCPDPSRLAVEFRSPSWYMGRKLRQDLADYLRMTGVATVITDVAGRRDVLHSTLTSRKVLIRFVGNELHPSDLTRAEAWVERLASWVSQGLEEIAFFVHQPSDAFVPELSRYLITRLNARCGLSVRSWSRVEAPAPPLNPQLTLF